MTMDAIAKDAGVGKSALYRGWPNKGKLLIDNVRAGRNPGHGYRQPQGRLPYPRPEIRHRYFGPTRMTYLRFQVEANLIPELQKVGEDYVRRQVLAGRGASLASHGQSPVAELAAHIYPTKTHPRTRQAAERTILAQLRYLGVLT